MRSRLTPQLVERVRGVVSRHTRRTPFIRSEWLSDLAGNDVYLKCENLQVTGSFKIRGALAALEMLGEKERAAGVVTASAGNHGMGLARAAAIFGVPCRVVVSPTVPRVKAEGMRKEGALVVSAPHEGYDAVLAWTLAHLQDLGGTFISAFDDPAVMAGNGGTTFLEIHEEAPELGTILLPCGGGGLACGAGIMARLLRPGLRVIGVNTEASPGMWLSRRDGRPHLEVASRPTIAEGIEGGVGELTYRLGTDLIDDVVRVPEAAIRRAVPAIARCERMVVEGAGGAGVAALLEGAAGDGPLAVVLTGSNIDRDLLLTLLGEDPTA